MWMQSVSTQIETLGQVVERLRQEREMTQEELAPPGLSARYLAAVEQDHRRPADPLLALLAERLAIAPASLRALSSPGGAPDAAALDEELNYRLEGARQAIDTDPIGALAQIDALAQEYADDLPHTGPHARYRLHYLRGYALIRQNEPAAACPELEAALALAEQLGDWEAVARVRNAVGVTYYSRDLPEQALEHHTRCLHAVYAGQVKDRNLKLVIVTNVASDCWALSDFCQAINLYHEAFQFLDDVNNEERRAAICTGLCLAYLARGEMNRAKLYGSQALALYEAARSPRYIAEAGINLAAILIADEEYDQAAPHLARSRALLEPAGDELSLSTVYAHYATLELAHGQIEQAATYAEWSRNLSEPTYRRRDESAGRTERANTTRTYGRALGTLGQVAERQGRPASADGWFRQALTVLECAECEETAQEIELVYANLLTTRGDHIQAVTHYAVAARRWRRRRSCINGGPLAVIL
jgi:hypothetical protein